MTQVPLSGTYSVYTRPFLNLAGQRGDLHKRCRLATIRGLPESAAGDRYSPAYYETQCFNNCHESGIPGDVSVWECSVEGKSVAHGKEVNGL